MNTISQNPHSPKKVLIIDDEVNIIELLSFFLKKAGFLVTVFLPLYRSVKDTPGVKEINSNLSIGSLGEDVPVYFIENDAYFDRPGIYGDGSGDYWDSLERFQFFGIKALETLKQLNIKIDMAHCHDWQTAVVPAHLK